MWVFWIVPNVSPTSHLLLLLCILLVDTDLKASVAWTLDQLVWKFDSALGKCKPILGDRNQAFRARDRRKEHGKIRELRNSQFSDIKDYSSRVSTENNGSRKSSGKPFKPSFLKNGLIRLSATINNPRKSMIWDALISSANSCSFFCEVTERRALSPGVNVRHGDLFISCLPFAQLLTIGDINMRKTSQHLLDRLVLFSETASEPVASQISLKGGFAPLFYTK